MKEYEVIEPHRDCNTARMWRVLKWGKLIAMFSSYSDAKEWAETRK